MVHEVVAKMRRDATNPALSSELQKKAFIALKQFEWLNTVDSMLKIGQLNDEIIDRNESLGSYDKAHSELLQKEEGRQHDAEIEKQAGKELRKILIHNRDSTLDPKRRQLIEKVYKNFTREDMPEEHPSD